MLQVEVFWVVTQCSNAVGYQRFGGPCYLHLQGEASRSSKTLVSYSSTTQRRIPEDLDLKLHRSGNLKSRKIMFNS